MQRVFHLASLVGLYAVNCGNSNSPTDSEGDQYRLEAFTDPLWLMWQGKRFGIKLCLYPSPFDFLIASIFGSKAKRKNGISVPVPDLFPI